jgi:hypothetical protein
MTDSNLSRARSKEYWRSKGKLIRYFRHYNAELGQGLCMTFTGGRHIKTGCGKSFTANKVAEEMDRTYDMKKLVYQPREFVKAMDLVEEIGDSSQVVVVDEGEITASARSWQSFNNAAIGYSLATNRYLRCNTIFCTPTFAWLDKRIRQLLTFWGVCEKKFDNQFQPENWHSYKLRVEMKLYKIMTTFYGDKTYAKKVDFYSIENNAMRVCYFNRINVSLPSEQLVADYEKKSKDFKRDLRKGLLRDLEKLSESFTSENEYTATEIFEQMKGNNKVLDTIVNGKGKVDSDLIQMEFPYLKGKEIRLIKTLCRKTWGV